MSAELFDRDGIHISTFAGPVRTDGKPRTCVQITNLNNPIGRSDTLVLTLGEWAALCAGIRELDRTIT